MSQHMQVTRCCAQATHTKEAFAPATSDRLHTDTRLLSVCYGRRVLWVTTDRESRVEGPFGGFGMRQSPTGNHVLECLPDELLFNSLTTGYATLCLLSTLTGACGLADRSWSTRAAVPEKPPIPILFPLSPILSKTAQKLTNQQIFTHKLGQSDTSKTRAISPTATTELTPRRLSRGPSHVKRLVLHLASFICQLRWNVPVTFRAKSISGATKSGDSPSCRYPHAAAAQSGR
jgi:hypothetical protein